MTLHLHFLDLGPIAHTKLLMTQFWSAKEGSEPATVTFNGFKLDKTAVSTKGNPKAFCQLILQQEPIKGRLATSLYDNARRASGKGNSNWIQLIFGLRDGKPLPRSLLEYSRHECKLGPSLIDADIKCFLHSSPTKLARAFNSDLGRPFGSGNSDQLTDQPALNREQMERLRTRILGNVQIQELDIEVMKNSIGSWRASNQPAVLPISAKDIFRLKTKMTGEAHVYVLWLDNVSRSVIPIFPWLPTPNRRWLDPQASERDRPRAQLALPEEYRDELPRDASQLQSIGPEGAEIVVVLVNQTRLNLEKLQNHFTKLPAQYLDRIPSRIENECELVQIETGTTAKTAGLNLAPEPEHDYIARLATWLGRLQLWVDDAQMLVIPTKGGSNSCRNSEIIST
ncbi:MAG: hypothetical protein J0M24_01975 [Verrucomicrobia bacterium]|nr:hypothetical protein [Verrucomicrobiota bacterium]